MVIDLPADEVVSRDERHEETDQSAEGGETTRAAVCPPCSTSPNSPVGHGDGYLPKTAIPSNPNAKAAAMRRTPAAV